MSDPKDGENRRPVDNIARQTLAQLRKRWGVEILTGGSPPEIHVITTHGTGIEVWVRVGAEKGGAARESTVYELRRP